MRPHRNSRGIGGLPPLHFLDHFGVGLLDENSDPSERLAPPITQLLDSRVYQLRGRVSSFSFLPPEGFWGSSSSWLFVARPAFEYRWSAAYAKGLTQSKANRSELTAIFAAKKCRSFPGAPVLLRRLAPHRARSVLGLLRSRF